MSDINISVIYRLWISRSISGKSSETTTYHADNIQSVHLINIASTYHILNARVYIVAVAIGKEGALKIKKITSHVIYLIS